ncbi:hypothetical protein FXF65_00755 [Actinomadura syzygii]|uniref:DUF4288 domain-containing protein n=1 Tax=Actinomadura syzygii TaxID=1427538 RepID=A0A5D0UJS0_9ACTN|nr:hypothetical protein FXF65_00755 [Actinomadura syzygii]
MSRAGWYGVRCVFRWVHEGRQVYEENVTVWRAGDFGEAIEKAEAGAFEYAAGCDGQYLEFAQAYFIGEDKVIGEGAEVFSLMRESELGERDYVTRYFDTGDERQGNVFLS